MVLAQVLNLVSGLLFLVTGVVSRQAQPGNRIGVLLLLAGVSWMFDFWVDPGTMVIAIIPAKLWAPLLGHVIVSFPVGRLRTPARRGVVAAAYAETVLLAVADAYDYAPVLDLEPVMTAVVGLGVVILLVRQWTRSSPVQRRTLTAMAGASLVAVLVFTAWEPAYRAGVKPPYLVLVLSLSGIPIAYLAGLVRRRMDRGAVADLVVRLSEGPHRASVREALATTLRDPGLRVGYWLADQRYVDADGNPMTHEPEQVLTRVNRGEQRVALLAHDPALLDNTELVDAACAAVGLALDNERLTAELRARLRQLAESRDKVLQAAENERRRIERDLHDGVQQRLLSIAMTLGLAEVAPDQELTKEAKTAVLATIDELRALCHGIHPPVLTERGLHGAVRELTAVTRNVELTLEIDTPLPPQVETTAYYVVAEALANVVKHADAGRTAVVVTEVAGTLVVRVDDDGCGGADAARGSGLRGLADRVEANGGTITVTSEPGRGTSVCVELPCG